MLAIVLFLNGMAIMILEMAGARLLAPWLGTSIVVWTSLIGIILASLSAGYWLGGRLADRMLTSGPKDGKQQKGKHNKAAFRMLSLLFAVAAGLTLVAACLSRPLLSYLAGLDSLHLATVLSSLALFAAPGVICGMISPFGTRLAITDSATAGSIIGRLNAVSTIGSIAGTFLGGFVLISWFGTLEIMLGVASCLLLASVLSSVRPLMIKGTIFTLIVLFGTIQALAGNGPGHAGKFTIETPYNTIVVSRVSYEGRPFIYLSTDPGKAQSGAFIDDYAELAFPYTRFYAIGPALKPDARHVLMLGGGGYSVPKWLLAGRSGLGADTLNLDVVEIDPGITRAAMDYLGFKANDPRLRIFHEDARTFVNNAAAWLTAEAGPPESAKVERPYDLVFMDVFNSWYSVPFHIGTLEAAAAVKKILAPDGIFIMNVISAVEGEDSRLFKAIYAAYKESFPGLEVYAVHSPKQGHIVQNLILIARNDGPVTSPEQELALPYDIRAMLKKRWIDPIAHDTPPLEDNFAPVEHYTLGLLSK